MIHRVLAAVAVAVLLTGCGSEAGEEAASTTAPAETTTAPPEETTTLTPNLGGRTTTATEADCPQIGFTPNSDDVAADIKVSGISCPDAAPVVRAVDTVPAGTLSYDLGGFTCTGREDDSAALHHVKWTCTQGDKRVTFSKF